MALYEDQFDIAKMMMTDYKPDLYIGHSPGAFAISGLLSSCNIELFKLAVEKSLVIIDDANSPLEVPMMFHLYNTRSVSL